MSLLDMVIMNSDGETPELEMAYDMNEYMLRVSEHSGDADDDDSGKSLLQKAVRRHRRNRSKPLSDAEWRKVLREHGHCTAMIRVTPNNTDIMMGHTTFSDYSELLRVFKYYDFPIGEATKKMGFSSYPGVVSSTDDFYVLDSGLAVTETTLAMPSDEPYDKMNDTAVHIPDFMRIMLANKMAKDAEGWVQMMVDNATGLYSSQWMVVDYNKFAPNKPLQNGTLWVMEQLPGSNHMEDMTDRLRKQGYWGSSNRAYFANIRDAEGVTDADTAYSAEKSPRANILRATAPHVASVADMRNEMQRNEWPHEIDGGRENTPDHAIAARSDLGREGVPNGGGDSKITSSCLMKALKADIISGPTHLHQKPFKWTENGKELYPTYPHMGLPDVFNFNFLRVNADGEEAATDGCSQ